MLQQTGAPRFTEFSRAGSGTLQRTPQLVLLFPATDAMKQAAILSAILAASHVHTRCVAGGIIPLETAALFAGFNVPWCIGARLWQQLKQQTKDFIRTASAAGLSAVGAAALRRRQQAVDPLVTIGGILASTPFLRVYQTMSPSARSPQAGKYCTTNCSCR